MSVCNGSGRFGNQIVRSIACSIIAKKFNLKIAYQKHYHKLKQLGIPLYIGTMHYNENKPLTDSNYISILDLSYIDFNITSCGYFQTKEISNKIHTYLNENDNMNTIMHNNPYSSRYNANNDCFVHIRLGDVAKYNPGVNYYYSILSTISFEQLYISTDSPNHPIINTLREYFPKSILYNNKIPHIILFASTCKYVILSYGTFSAIIGYISYYSEVHCLPYCSKYAWDWHLNDECNMFQEKKTKVKDWIIHYEFDNNEL